MATAGGFIERHGLWTDDQRRHARALPARIKKEKLKLFRVAWADPHGASRAKTVTLPAFLDALENGYNINVATTTLDASGARTFASFTRGGGMDLDEMTGSPNLIIVPDPATFRILPWEPNVGWILCDEYFVSGKPFYFSPRHLLRRQSTELSRQFLSSLLRRQRRLPLRRNMPHGRDRPLLQCQRSDHVQQADECSNEPHEDQKAGHVAQQRFLVIDRLADFMNQRVHRFDGKTDLLRSRQLFGDEVVCVAEQAGSFEHPSRSRTTIMAPKGIPLLLAGTDPYVVPHLLEGVERDDFVL